MFWLFNIINKNVKLQLKFPVQLVNVFIVHKYILILDLMTAFCACF